jgi:protein transport protein SEC24
MNIGQQGSHARPTRARRAYAANQPGYPQQAQPGYPQQAQTGYPQQAQTGYPQQAQPGYPQQAQTGYPQQAQPGYPQQAQTGYPQQAQPGYPQQAQPGYSQQAQTGYPQQSQPGVMGGSNQIPAANMNAAGQQQQARYKIHPDQIPNPIAVQLADQEAYLSTLYMTSSRTAPPMASTQFVAYDEGSLIFNYFRKLQS